MLEYMGLRFGVVVGCLAGAVSCNKVTEHFEIYARQQVQRASLLADACSSVDGTASALTATPSAESMQSAFISLFHVTELHTLSSHAFGRAQELIGRARLAKAVLTELTRDEDRYLKDLRAAHIWQVSHKVVTEIEASEVVKAVIVELKKAPAGAAAATDAAAQIVRTLTQISDPRLDGARLGVLSIAVDDLIKMVDGYLNTFEEVDQLAGKLGMLAKDLRAKVSAACAPNVAAHNSTAASWILQARTGAEKCLSTVAIEVNAALKMASFEIGTATPVPGALAPNAAPGETSILQFVTEGGKSDVLSTVSRQTRSLPDAVPAVRKQIATLIEGLSQFQRAAPEILSALEPVSAKRPDIQKLIESLLDETRVIGDLLELDPKSSVRVLVSRFASYQINAHVDVLLRWIVRGVSALEKRLDSLSNGNLLIGLLRAAADVAGLDRRIGQWIARVLVKNTDRFKISRAMLVSRTCELQEQLGATAPALLSMFLEEIVLAIDPTGTDDPLLVAAVAHGIARAQVDVATREAGVLLPSSAQQQLTTEIAANMMGHVTDAPREFPQHSELTAHLVVDLSVHIDLPELQRFAGIQADLLRGMVTDHVALAQRSRTEAEQTAKAIQDLASAVGKLNEKVDRTQAQVRGIDRVNRMCLNSKTLAKQGSSSFTCLAQTDVEKNEKPKLLVHYKLSGFPPCGFELSKEQTESLDQFADVLEQALGDPELKVSIRGYASKASPEKCIGTTLSSLETREWKRWCEGVKDKFGHACAKSKQGTPAAAMLNESLAAERARQAKNYLLATTRLKGIKGMDLPSRLEIVSSQVAGGQSEFNLSVAVIIQ